MKMEKIRSIPYMMAIKKGSDATFFCAPTWARTRDPQIMSLLL
ncbi:MAG: hypothetical protein RL106_131 [Bacteroidota bacterium]